MDSLIALWFLFTASLGIVTIATMGYLFSGHSLEMRFLLVASLLLIATLFAFSPLLFIARDPELRAALEKKGREYTEAPKEKARVAYPGPKEMVKRADG